MAVPVRVVVVVVWLFKLLVSLLVRPMRLELALEALAERTGQTGASQIFLQLLQLADMLQILQLILLLVLTEREMLVQVGQFRSYLYKVILVDLELRTPHLAAVVAGLVLQAVMPLLLLAVVVELAGLQQSLPQLFFMVRVVVRVLMSAFLRLALAG
jgi:hypothetical protein